MTLLKTTFCFTLFILSNILYAQTKAITETGIEVLLYDNGSWQFANKEDAALKEEVRVNTKKLVKSTDATFLVRSTKTPIGININPKEWSFKKADDHESAEFEFKHKDHDLFGLIISEKTEIPVETLKKIAYDNAKEAAPDIVIKDQEYRNVNGLDVFMMEMWGSVQGIKIIYKGYYFSNEQGTTQIVVYTGQNMAKSLSKDIEKFLNGFVTL